MHTHTPAKQQQWWWWWCVPFVKRRFMCVCMYTIHIYPHLYRDLLSRPMHNRVQWRERYYFPRVYSTLHRVQCALVNCRFACVCLWVCATAIAAVAAAAAACLPACFECSPLFVLCACAVCCYFITTIFPSSTSQYSHPLCPPSLSFYKSFSLHNRME